MKFLRSADSAVEQNKPLRDFHEPNRRPSGVRAVFLLTLMLPLVVGVLTGCGGEHSQSDSAASKEETLYTCGMHPQVIQNKPGNCPICGMKLTPIRKQAGPNRSGTNASPESTAPASFMITLDPATIQNMGLRTGFVSRGPVRRTVRTVGSVDFDETELMEVTTKFKGWIQKLYVDYTGQQVHRGDALFEVYSPELYSAQTEYMLALNGTTAQPGTGADLIKRSA